MALCKWLLLNMNQSPSAKKADSSPPAVSNGGKSSRAASGGSNNDEGRSSEIRIIQELFQDYNELGYKQSLSELDRAFEDRCPLIVIEPLRLGDETARWIAVGNFLHKATVLSGLAAIFALKFVSDRWYAWSPLAVTCAATYAAYSLSWQGDPASQYQVEKNEHKLADLKLNNLNTHSVIVLTRKNDYRRRVLHTSVAALALVTVSVHLYQRKFN